MAKDVQSTADRRSASRRRARKDTAVDRTGHALQLDRLVHERMRLAILSALAVSDSLTFNELKAALQTTDGNLSVHARRLEDAGYIACTKSFENRMPKTEYRLTASGRDALEDYLDRMEKIIRASRR